VTSTTDGSTLPSLVVHLERERARVLVRAAFPRRKWKIITTRSAEELEAVFRRELVDAALVDIGAPDEDTWKAAAFAAEFPSAPFFAIMPLRLRILPPRRVARRSDLSTLSSTGSTTPRRASWYRPTPSPLAFATPSVIRRRRSVSRHRYSAMRGK
jgi:hypothetical protein